MPPPHHQAILGALANASRVRTVDALLDAPRCVEELAERLGLSASTVSHHLKRLESAGLVRKSRDQYYQLYRLTDGWLDLSLRTLVKATSGDQRGRAAAGAQAFRDKVVRAFFRGPRLRQLPVQKRKRDVVLDVLAADFEPGRSYPEAEVNAVIARRYDDYCTIRRLLVDRGTMSREAGVYVLHARPTGAPTVPGPAPSEPLSRKARRRELARQARSRPRVAGVYRVTNLDTRRFLLGSSLNVQARLNRQRAELEMHSARPPDLQADWDALGADRFRFELLETVEDRPDPSFSLERELEALEAAWIERLRPFDGGAYDTGGRIRI